MRKLSQVHYQSKGDSIRGSEIETGTSIDVWLCGAGKLTNLSLFSAEPEEAEEKASGTKAENKKFIVKRQQKDLPVHNSNNGDNGGKKKN